MAEVIIIGLALVAILAYCRLNNACRRLTIQTELDRQRLDRAFRELHELATRRAES